MNTILENPTNPHLILVIDDDLFIQMQLRLYLEREGYEVIFVNNGQEGIEAYLQYHPDLVLLDAIMPTMNGFECCQELLKLPGAEYTPILIITALDDQQSVDHAFEIGVADYVTKPIHWAVLRQRVKRLLHQVHLRKQLEASNLLLQRLAILDPLTQISNRRHFEKCLHHEWKRLEKEKFPLSLIMIDVDYFKPYNDTYGHPAGDICLHKIAQTITAYLRNPADLACRYGGEEFAIILPNTNLTGGKCVAHNLNRGIKNLKIAHQSSLVSEWVTISLGLSCMIPNHKIVPEQLIQQADQALYQAKFQGRDRLISFPDIKTNSSSLHQTLV